MSFSRALFWRKNQKRKKLKKLNFRKKSFLQKQKIKSINEYYETTKEKYADIQS